jgi:hypothetical protein
VTAASQGLEGSALNVMGDITYPPGSGWAGGLAPGAAQPGIPRILVRDGPAEDGRLEKTEAPGKIVETLRANEGGMNSI